MNLSLSHGLFPNEPLSIVLSNLKSFRYLGQLHFPEFVSHHANLTILRGIKNHLKGTKMSKSGLINIWIYLHHTSNISIGNMTYGPIEFQWTEKHRVY